MDWWILESMICDKCGIKTLNLGTKSYNLNLNLCIDCKEELDEIKSRNIDEFFRIVADLGGKDKTKNLKENDNFLDKLKKLQGRSWNIIKVKVYVDGSKHPKSDVCGYGFVVRTPDNPYKKEFQYGSDFNKGTVLEAEAKAVFEALKYIKNHFSRKDRIELYTDNGVIRSFLTDKITIVGKYSDKTMYYINCSRDMLDRNIKVKKIASKKNITAHNLANKYRLLAEGKPKLAYQYET